MRTVSEEIYTYSELTGEAKERAGRFIQEGLQDIESQWITEAFREDLKALGYPAKQVNWSLSYCQGDGVAFYGNFYALEMAEKRLKAAEEIPQFALPGEDTAILRAFLETGEHFSVEIEKCNPHYDHENSMEIVTAYDESLSPTTEKAVNDFLDFIRADVKIVSSILRKNGYAEIEYYGTDEYIAEHAAANEYEFYADGRFYMG